MSLDAGELRILEILRQGPRECKEPVSDRLRSLVKRGYCRFSKGRSGPIGIYDGSTMIALTDAGIEISNTACQNAIINSEQ